MQVVQHVALEAREGESQAQTGEEGLIHKGVRRGVGRPGRVTYPFLSSTGVDNYARLIPNRR